jgi:hypothetical protein
MTEQDERLMAISALILFTKDVEKELKCKIDEFRTNPKTNPVNWRGMFEFYKICIETMTAKQKDHILKLTGNNAKQ